jgi:hypothetical protein
LQTEKCIITSFIVTTSLYFVSKATKEGIVILWVHVETGTSH